MLVKPILAKHCFPLRQSVLRDGKALKYCHFEGDNQKSTYHLGAFSNDSIVGIVSLFKTAEPLLNFKSQYQLRGMAIHTNYRGQAIGTTLIKNAEEYLKRQSIEVLWCNARTSALEFYKKQAYQIFSDEFEIEGVGPHFKLYKVLLP